MALVTAPIFRFTSVEWDFNQPGQVNASQWTGKRTVMADPWHGKWTAKVTLRIEQGEAAFRPIRAFMAALKGRINYFYLPASLEGAQYSGSNPTLSANAAQGATSVSISTVPLLAGMFVTFPLPSGNVQLVMLTQDMSGGTITFRPPLREAVSSGATLEALNPYAQMALSDSTFKWQVGVWRRYSLSFDCEEAF